MTHATAEALVPSKGQASNNCPRRGRFARGGFSTIIRSSSSISSIRGGGSSSTVGFGDTGGSTGVGVDVDVCVATRNQIIPNGRCIETDSDDMWYIESMSGRSGRNRK